MAGENRAQIRHDTALGGGAIDIGLGPEGEVLPEDLQRTDETERNPIGIQLRLGGFDDQSFDELAHQDRKALVLLSANVVVFLPRAGFAPKGVPNRDLARAGNPRIEIKIDQELEVYIINVDKEREKIALGLKQKSPSPWENVADKYGISRPRKSRDE